MHMIMDAISPEQLKVARELFMREDRMMRDDPAAQAEAINNACRRKADHAAEEADRAAFANRHERRKQKALAR